MNENTISELKEKIADTYSDLYVGRFYDPINDICEKYRAWIDSFDEYQTLACKTRYHKQYFCDCDRLDHSREWNVGVDFDCGGGVVIELYKKNGTRFFINVRNALAEKRIEIPSFFDLAGRVSRIFSTVSQKSITDFVDDHFEYEGGKYVGELAEVKKYLEIDYAPLYNTIALAFTDIIKYVNGYADKAREEKEKSINSLMAEFGMGQEKTPHYKTIEIKIVYS